MEKSIYTREIRALKKHRKSYLARLEKLYTLYSEWDAQKRLSIGYTAENGMLEILELIDTGFLRADAFNIKTHFGDYQAVYYYGAHPFTEKGINFLIESRKARKLQTLCMICGAALLFIVLITAQTC